MPFESPDGATFDDFQDCVDTLTEDGSMSVEGAKAACGLWQSQTKDNFIRANAVDPTESKTLRKQFQQRLGSRWRDVRGQNREWIMDMDPSTEDSVALQRYRQHLLRFIMDTVVESTSDRQVRRGQHWTAQPVRTAYQKGLTLAGRDFNSLDGVPDEVIQSATRFTADHNQSELQSLYVRTYSKLESQGEDARGFLQDVFAEGLAQEKSRTALVDETNSILRGKVVNRARAHASTTVVRSVNRALLTAFENAGVTQIGFSVEAEVQPNRDNYSVKANAAGEVQWETAGDSNVCPVCQGLAGTVLKISEVKGSPQFQPPVHPNCRCRLVPTAMELKSTGETIPAP